MYTLGCQTAELLMVATNKTSLQYLRVQDMFARLLFLFFFRRSVRLGLKLQAIIIERAPFQSMKIVAIQAGKYMTIHGHKYNTLSFGCVHKYSWVSGCVYESLKIPNFINTGGHVEFSICENAFFFVQCTYKVVCS